MLNFKGGVGKTTAAVNLGAALAQLKKKVLLIDLDVQGTATNTFKTESPFEGDTIYEFLSGKTKEAFAYDTKVKNLDYVPSSPDMRFAETELNRKREREHILQKFVNQVAPSYDYVLLDCPPGEGIVTDNAMVAATQIIIPIKCEVYSMYGLQDIMTSVQDLKENSNPSLEIMGIVANEFDGRICINRDIISGLEKSFPGKVFQTRIRKNVALAEFSSSAQNIFEYDPKCRGAEDYMSLAKEVIKKTRNQEKNK